MSLKSVCLLSVLFVSLPAFGQSVTSELYKQALAVHESNYGESLSLFEKVLLADPDNTDALFEAAFLHTKIGKRAAKPEDRELHYKTAMEMAERCLKLNATSAKSHFIMGVAYGRMSEIQTAKIRVENSRKIRSHCEKAIEIQPDLAGAWHILGKLHFRLSNMTMVEKAAAQVIYGGLPPGSTTEVAISCYRKAVALRPDYLLYQLDLAAALHSTGKKEEAKSYFQQIVKAKGVTEDDVLYKTEAATQLTRL